MGFGAPQRIKDQPRVVLLCAYFELAGPDISDCYGANDEIRSFVGIEDCPTLESGVMFQLG
jgi:hypothetical protein